MKNKKIIIISAVTIMIISAGLLYFYQYRSNEKAKKDEMNNEIELVESEIEDETNQNELKDGTLGILKIEKINMKGLVKEGSTSDILQNYIGHIENTPKYDGNICLAAHNRGNTYSYFAKLNQLSEGDEIKYQTIFGESYFSVNQIKEINENDWSMLEDSDENKLTLITCIKNKSSSRLCVQATRKDI